jgi:hypothetical protein
MLGTLPIMWPNMRWKPKSPRIAFCFDCRALLPPQLSRLAPTALQRCRRMSPCSLPSRWAWRRSDRPYRCLSTRSLSTGTRDLIATPGTDGSEKHASICSQNPVPPVPKEESSNKPVADHLRPSAAGSASWRYESRISCKIADWRARHDSNVWPSPSEGIGPRLQDQFVLAHSTRR